MFHEYSYEVVRRFNEEKLSKAARRRQLLESTSDSFAPSKAKKAEIIELAFGLECEHTEPMGA